MQKFATPAPISTVLDIPAGLVRFIAADRNDTSVEIRPANAAKSRDVQAAEQTEVAFADGVLRIRGEVRNQILGASGAVEITVQLPAGSRVEAKAASAEFRGVGRLGDIAFEAAQSDIKLDEAANVRLTTQAGDVTVGRLTGSAEISTRKGDITVGVAAGLSASLDAGTSYGRIDNSLKNSGTPDLTIRATTAYGDITARSL
jgi:Putative adhesin